MICLLHAIPGVIKQKQVATTIDQQCGGEFGEWFVWQPRDWRGPIVMRRLAPRPHQRGSPSSQPLLSLALDSTATNHMAGRIREVRIRYLRISLIGNRHPRGIGTLLHCCPCSDFSTAGTDLGQPTSKLNAPSQSDLDVRSFVCARAHLVSPSPSTPSSTNSLLSPTYTKAPQRLSWCVDSAGPEPCSSPPLNGSFLVRAPRLPS
jgi:hypothetical protein